MKSKDLTSLMRKMTGRTGLEETTSFTPRSLPEPRTPPEIPETNSRKSTADREADFEAMHAWLLDKYGVTEQQIRGWIAIGFNPPGGGSDGGAECN